MIFVRDGYPGLESDAGTTGPIPPRQRSRSLLPRSLRGRASRRGPVVERNRPAIVNQPFVRTGGPVTRTRQTRERPQRRATDVPARQLVLGTRASRCRGADRPVAAPRQSPRSGSPWPRIRTRVDRPGCHLRRITDRLVPTIEELPASHELIDLGLLAPRLPTPSRPPLERRARSVDRGARVGGSGRDQAFQRTPFQLDVARRAVIQATEPVSERSVPDFKGQVGDRLPRLCDMARRDGPIQPDTPCRNHRVDA